jgi:hypothetical protein
VRNAILITSGVTDQESPLRRLDAEDQFLAFLEHAEIDGSTAAAL